MSSETQRSLTLVGVFAGGLALTLFIVFAVISGFGLIWALLLALLIGIIVALLLMVLLYRPPGASAKETLEHLKQTVVPSSETSDTSGADRGDSGVEEPAPAATAGVASAYTPAPVAEPEPEPEPEPEHVPEPEPEPAPVAATEADQKPAPEPAQAAPSTEPVGASDGGSKPTALEGPRGGAADDLKKIKGVGPKLEGVLNNLGFYHFDQVANWTADEVAWVDENLEGFKGRVSRDDWVAQAKLLAEGGETEFSKKVDKGDMY